MQRLTAIVLKLGSKCGDNQVSICKNFNELRNSKERHKQPSSVYSFTTTQLGGCILTSKTTLLDKDHQRHTFFAVVEPYVLFCSFSSRGPVFIRLFRAWHKKSE